MKKIFFILACLIAMCQQTYAYDFCDYNPSGKWLYYNIVGGEAQVTYQRDFSPRYSNLSGTVVIPSSVTYGGTTYSVTSIDEYAFYGCSGLTSVVVPNSVTSIGRSAFFGCSGLTLITIGDSVISIGHFAFSGCSGLTSFTIPNSISSIGTCVFRYCSGLTSITIPNSVTSIGDQSFYGCSGLTSITIPNSVTSIDPNAFDGCSGLTSVNYIGTIAQWCGIDFVNSKSNPTYYSHSLSMNGTPLFNLVIPAGITEIKHYTFYGCSGLTSVTIPNSVTSIGNYAFNGCSGLASVTIPNTVTSIGNSAFYNCNGLTEITTLAPTAPTLGSDAFSGVSSTIPVYIPSGSRASYQTAWGYFSNFVEPFTINIGVNDSTFGTVNITIGSNYDNIAVIEAIANYGYHFTQWNDGNTQNPRTITLTQDTTFTAYFDRNEYQLTLNNASPTFGTVSGSGTYLYLDTAHIVADAIDHHHLVRWSDGDRNATRDIVISSDLQLVATFAIDTHTVTVVSNDIARGMVETTGTEFVYGTPCTVTATAYSGYTFARWSNGVTYNPYTFAVLEDTELIAIFEEEATQGIDDVANTDNIRIFSKYNRIIIDGLNGQDVTIYTIDGRTIASLPRATEHVAIPVTTVGVYIVKIGEHSARKVVVIR